MSLAHKWERYWQDRHTTADVAIWDSSAERNAARHLPLFTPHLAPSRPLIDVGCGSGTQTWFLARHVDQVLGVDHAEAALATARTNHGDQPADAVQFRLLDLLDPAAAASLHREVGDANLYMRGVLHQFETDQRPVALRSLCTLLGTAGALFAVEPEPHAPAQAHTLATGQDADKLAAVAAHDLRWGMLAEDELPHLLTAAGLQVLTSGPATVPLHTNTTPAELTAHYVLARP